MSEDFRFFVFFRCLGTLMGSSSESASESIIVKTLLCLEVSLYKKPYLSYRNLSDILKTLPQRIKSFQKPSGLGELPVSRSLCVSLKEAFFLGRILELFGPKRFEPSVIVVRPGELVRLKDHRLEKASNFLSCGHTTHTKFFRNT